MNRTLYQLSYAAKYYACTQASIIIASGELFVNIFFTAAALFFSNFQKICSVGRDDLGAPLTERELGSPSGRAVSEAD